MIAHLTIALALLSQIPAGLMPAPQSPAEVTPEMTPDRPSTEAAPEEAEAPVDRKAMRIINRRMTVDGREYAWSVIIPAGVKPGGAGLLFLHGYGECGLDGMRQLGVGLPPAIGANPDRWPFVIIVPQKPVHNSEWEHHEKAVLAMLDLAAEEGLYDKKRLAITGLSQGGHGTIAIAGRNPDRFQAVAPVCGYNAPRFDEAEQRRAGGEVTPEDPAVVEAAKRIRYLPVWIFHGSLDNVVPPAESRSLHAALKDLHADTMFTELPEANHNSWDGAYANPEFASWLVNHTR